VIVSIIVKMTPNNKFFENLITYMYTRTDRYSYSDDKNYIKKVG